MAPIYDNIPFQKYVKFWEDSLIMIGKDGWSTFSHLFFHPDGELCGVNDFFVKAPPPSSSLTQKWEWVAQATVISRNDWSSFKFLFFDPDGMLYGVHDGKLYKGQIHRILMRIGWKSLNLWEKADGPASTFFFLTVWESYMVSKMANFISGALQQIQAMTG